MHTFKSFIAEILDSTNEKLKKIKDTDKVKIYSLTVGQHPIEYTAAQWEPGKWIFYFKDEDDDTWALTGKGHQFEVFAGAKQILDDLINKHKAKQINFEAREEDGGGEKRIELYRKFIKKYTPPHFKVEEDRNGEIVYFKFTKLH